MVPPLDTPLDVVAQFLSACNLYIPAGRVPARYPPPSQDDPPPLINLNTQGGKLLHPTVENFRDLPVKLAGSLALS